MKKRPVKLFVLVTTLLISSFSFAQNLENPGEYMSHISKQRMNIAKRFLSYNSAVSHGKRAKKVENLRNKLLDEVQESRMNIASMPSFQTDKEYRDSAVSFMKLYYNVLNEDYNKIVNMEEVAEQSYDLMEALLLAKELVSKKLHDANEKLHAISLKFAAAHNVNIINKDDEISTMMEKVGEVNTYYNPLYLIFFKSYKQEVYLMDAIDKKNVNGIEQNKNSLLQFAQDGLKQLESVKAFQGDNSIVSNCRRMLEFYVKEVNDKMPAISDYFLKTESFDKMQKEFDKKSSPTKEEVDAFNKSVKDINTAVNNFNSTMKNLFEMRKGLLDNWNGAVDSFFDSHMPSYK